MKYFAILCLASLATQAFGQARFMPRVESQLPVVISPRLPRYKAMTKSKDTVPNGRLRRDTAKQLPRPYNFPPGNYPQRTYQPGSYPIQSPASQPQTITFYEPSAIEPIALNPAIIITCPKTESETCEYTLISGQYSYPYRMKPGFKQTFNAANGRWRIRFKDGKEQTLKAGESYTLRKTDRWTAVSTPVTKQESPDSSSKTNLTDDQAKLNASLETWQVMKEAAKGNYSYKVGKSSFMGWRSETRIVVKNNVVIERSYREYVPPHSPKPQGETGWTEKWVETSDEVGKHEIGGAAKTLDDLYSEAAEVLEHKLTISEKRHVSFDEAGLLKTCFYVDTKIMDDSPTHGVSIYGLEME